LGQAMQEGHDAAVVSEPTRSGLSSPRFGERAGG
jgi:hypothetical protein